MSYLARLVDGVTVPYSEAQLRADYPDVSFPADLTQADLHEYGCFFSDAYSAEHVAQIEAFLLASIDRQAGAFRKRFITDVPGQAETYLQKRQEAEAFLVDPEGSFPMLEAEAPARDMTIAELAAEVVATASAWAELGAAIEGARMGAKHAVRLAVTLEDKRAAAQVDWEALLP